MQIPDGKKYFWLIGLWAIAGLLWAGDGKPAMPESPELSETEGAVNESVRQLMNTWPAQAIDLTGNSSQDNLPDLSFEQYAQTFRKLSPEMPLSFMPEVQTYIEWFGGSKRKELEVMMGLSAYYFPIFEAELARGKMPSTLKYLPVALSALNPRSVGNDGTGGLWRLHYHVALRYGLEISDEKDERRDVVKSTQAALAYLKDLHKVFGNWDQAIAAYSCGPAGVRKAMMRAENPRDFSQVYHELPVEQRAFTPAFRALVYLFNQKDDLALQPGTCPLPMAKEGVTIQQPVAFSVMSKFSKISEMKLRDMNPLYRSLKIPAGVNMSVPEGTLTMIMSLMDTIYKASREVQPEVVAIKVASASSNPSVEPKTIVPVKTSTTPANTANSVPAGRTLVNYTIASGDNLGAIAEKYHVSVTELRTWNHIRGTAIRAGDQLKIYVSGKAPAKTASSPPANTQPKVTPTPTRPTTTKGEEFITYTVKSGDNLWSIAKRYPGVSDQDIMRWNGITDALQPGQVLKIRKQ